MEQKSSNPNRDLWFTCNVCGTEYDEHCEVIVPKQDIRGTIEWANTHLSLIHI